MLWPLALGFTQRGIYNNLGKEDKTILEGGEAKHLVDTFKDRAWKENNYFSPTQLDSDDYLVSFFYRVSQMKMDYLLFVIISV